MAGKYLEFKRLIPFHEAYGERWACRRAVIRDLSAGLATKTHAGCRD